MDSSEILKLMGISAGGFVGLLSICAATIKLAIPIFAKARLDANSLGAADKLIENLQEEKRSQAEEFRLERIRCDEALKAERERSDTIRKVLEATTQELYRVREALSKLSNENITLVGKVEELKRQVNALRGVSDD